MPGAEPWCLQAVGSWGPRASVKWLHGAIPDGFCFLQTHYLWRLLGGGSLPTNLLVSVTFSPFGHCKDRPAQPAGGLLVVPAHCPLPTPCPPAIPSAPGAWCLCSNDSPVQLPGLVSTSCKKHHRGPGQSRDWVGEGLMHFHLGFSLFPWTPLLEPLPGILRTLEAPGDLSPLLHVSSVQPPRPGHLTQLC